MKKFRCWCLSLSVLSLFAVSSCSDSQSYDVVVYGGTSSGVIAAVAAAREGASVLLLAPGRHLGGMSSGGLGQTDFGKKETIGGTSLEFYRRVGKHYGKDFVWSFEPHVAENVFREMAAEAGVQVFYEHRLREKDGARLEEGRITELRMENGATFKATVFIDATYEGDLMGQAGVSYTWGRESVSTYGEPAAGVYDTKGKRFSSGQRKQFEVEVSAYDEQGNPLPEVFEGPRGELGEADQKLQAYCYRLCLSDDPKNQVSFPKPPDYDPGRYALLVRILKALEAKIDRPLQMSDMFIVSRLEKDSKTDINNNGRSFFSTDYIGKNWDYATAGYARRAEIWQDHENYTKGLLYFLAHDPQVPSSAQKAVNEWGLCKDEFTDNGNWPHQLYIREARRMVGGFVMTQKDIQEEVTKPDAIGMGSYPSDSHNVQRYIQKDGTVYVEGNTYVPVTPYQIPYRVMLPKKEEVENLLVPVTVSASHVAFSTLRMEPVYMIIGQAAGVAAKMAVDGGKAVQDIDREALQEKLRRQGTVFVWKK